MQKWTLSILSYKKKTRLLKNGDAPIYLRITLNGYHAGTTINKHIAPRLWDSSRGYAKTSDQNGIELNYYLNQVRQQVYQLQRELVEKKEPVTALSHKCKKRAN